MLHALARIAAVFAFAAGLEPQSGAQEMIWKSYGSPAYSTFGYAVDALVDVTGDGISDVIAGSSVTNYARVVSGGDGSTFYHLYTITGDFTYFGHTVAGLGDVDGDGLGDFAIGAYLDDVGTTNSGSVTIYSGASGTPLHTIYEDNADFFGYALSAVGDVDLDGTNDLLVGAFAMHAFVISGTTGATIFDLTAPGRSLEFGNAVGGGGDVDGDGIPDLMVADTVSSNGSNRGGAAYLYLGSTGSSFAEFDSHQSNAEFGAGMAILGDYDHDGWNDVVVGGPGRQHVVVYSSQTGAEIYGYRPDNGAKSQFGFCARGVGDTNGDGVSDFLITDPGSNDNSLGSLGAGYLYSGSDGQLLYHFRDDSHPHGGDFGTTAAATGDLDGDGIADFLFGSPDEGYGTVSAWRGHRLWVDAMPRNVVATQSVTLSVGQGSAGALYALFLVEVGGAPTFTLLTSGAFDANGRASLSGSVPSGVSATTLKFQAFALDASSKIVPTGVETLYIH